MEGQRVCDSYLHGFVGAHVALLSDMAQDTGAPGRPPWRSLTRSSGVFWSARMTEPWWLRSWKLASR
eukprot:5971-Alexandrium_andersonii.AAC.1